MKSNFRSTILFLGAVIAVGGHALLVTGCGNGHTPGQDAAPGVTPPAVAPVAIKPNVINPHAGAARMHVLDMMKQYKEQHQGSH